jgi:hypothetical protein
MIQNSCDICPNLGNCNIAEFQLEASEKKWHSKVNSINDDAYISR